MSDESYKERSRKWQKKQKELDDYVIEVFTFANDFLNLLDDDQLKFFMKSIRGEITNN